MRLRTVLLVVALVGVGVVTAGVLTDRGPVLRERCVVEVGDRRAVVDTEQARWASLMAATAERRGLPPRATTIAIATAYQESKIRNIDYGDRDSVGLFQQRPSQGWGTVEQIMDPAYAIGAFYDELVEVDGYGSMEVTDAAQEVQRSAFPLAYADHEDDARALASALRGQSAAAFTCRLGAAGDGDPDRVVDDVQRAFGGDPAGVVADGSVTYPVADGEVGAARGWALAQYLVANADHLELASVAHDGRTWTADASADGWVAAPRAGGDEVVATVG